MLRRVALGALIVALAPGARPTPAAADAEDDARAVFGLGDSKRRAADAPAGCDPATDFGCAFATDPFTTASPYALASTLDLSRWRDLPGSDLDHDAIAAIALGANRDEAGPTFGAASGLENRWLVEGAAAESLRTGGVDTRVPLRFLTSMRVQAGGFSAADRASTGGAIDAKLLDAAGLDDHELAAEVWASAGAPGRDLPPIPLFYEPVRAHTHDLRALSLGVVARGPLPRVAGTRPWYAGAIRPVLHDDGIARTAQRLVDVDANGAPDLDGYNVPITERIDERDLGELGFTVPAMVRAGATRGAHTIELTGLVTAYRDTRWISRATESAAGVRRNGVILDGIVTWRGTWPSWRARVIASWHRHASREKPRRGRDDTPQIATAFLPVPAELPEEPAIAAACDDNAASDPYPGIPNCPVPRGLFARDGAGLLFGQTADRPAIVADVAHRLGRHTLAAGVTGEDGRLATRRRYTGGVAVRSLFALQSDSIEFVEVGDSADATACSSDPLVTDRCRRLAESSITFRTRYLAAYARDTYRPITPLALDAGLRWESFTLGDAFTFSPELAPRAGAAWDFLGGGRSRAFVGLGRSFALLPAGLGDTVVERPATRRELVLGPSVSYLYDPGDPAPIAGGLDPIVVDEVVAGAEIAVANAVRALAFGQARLQREGLDTERGRFANPGDDGIVAATRRSQQLGLELATAPTARLGVRVLYQYTRSAGTIVGPFDPRQGTVLYAGDDFDAVAGDANLDGWLPGDARHRALTEAVVRAKVRGFPIVIGLRGQLASGRPVSAVARTSLGVMHLVQRGRAGRLGHITTTSLHGAVDLGRVELVVDAFNLFHRQRAVAVDEVYTDDEVLPIDGGSADDLIFLKRGDGSAVVRNPGFGLATGRQAPFSVAIGVRARL